MRQLGISGEQPLHLAMAKGHRSVISFLDQRRMATTSTIKKKERVLEFSEVHRNGKELHLNKHSTECDHSAHQESINTGLICLSPHDEHGRRGLERSVNCGKLEIPDDDDDSSLISM